MPHHRKTPDDVAREALIQAGLRAPNQRQFTLNDDYAKTLCHPPSLLPKFPHYAARVIWGGEDPVSERPVKRRPKKGRK